MRPGAHACSTMMHKPVIPVSLVPSGFLELEMNRVNMNRAVKHGHPGVRAFFFFFSLFNAIMMARYNEIFAC